jgi:hypothetical protein
MIAPTSKRETVRPAAGAKGGKTPMAKPQAANPQKSGGTAHAVKGGAPGAMHARGGGKSTDIGGRSAPAKAGRTGPRKG